MLNRELKYFPESKKHDARAKKRGDRDDQTSI